MNEQRTLWNSLRMKPRTIFCLEQKISGKDKKHVNFSKFVHKGDKAKKKDGGGCKTLHKVDWKNSKDHGNNLF